MSLFYENWLGKGCLCDTMLSMEGLEGITLKDALEKDFVIEGLQLAQIEELRLLAGDISIEVEKMSRSFLFQLLGSFLSCPIIWQCNRA